MEAKIQKKIRIAFWIFPERGDRIRITLNITEYWASVGEFDVSSEKTELLQLLEKEEKRWPR